jgi:hypothetical protein
MNFWLEYSAYSIVPAVLLLLFFEKRRPLAIFQIFLWALSALVLTAFFIWALAFFFRDGYAALFLGVPLAVLTWTVFAKWKLQIRFLTLPFVVLLPVGFLSLSHNVATEFKKLEAPERQAEFNNMAVQMGLNELTGILKNYRVTCGFYPQNLSLMVKPHKTCPKWKGASTLDYRNGEAFIDPWGRPYIYTILSPNAAEVMTFGADGTPGGEGPNHDEVLRTRSLDPNSID